MKRLVMMLMVLVAVGGTTEVSAQSFLKKLGKKIEETAKRKVENKVERTTEKAMDTVLDGKGTSNNNNGNNNADAVYDNGDGAAQVQPQKGQSLETTYAKSDFVPGDEIFFEDNLANEQMGEFPSQWDLLRGNAEVASMAGVQAINLEAGSTATIAPLMKE
ncbi:MAG: OmpA family protein, partial [Bacteroidaceae bacterium]|nr:OmpA family protein [Bacteroidaceae bacterium]